MKPTLKETIDTGIIIGMSPVDSEAFFQHYNAQGWVLGNGLPIVNLQSAMAKWRTRQHKYEKQGQKQRLLPIIGKVCSKDKCGMPAVLKGVGGNYDFYYCAEHLPEKVKEKYN